MNENVNDLLNVKEDDKKCTSSLGDFCIASSAALSNGLVF